MERKTTPGRTYAIYSTLGCLVTNGSETVTVPAATTTYITAYRGDIEISDDAAECVEVFKLAPYQKLRLLGVVGGDDAWLPDLNKQLESMLDGTQFETAWLADENTLVVHTDRVDDELLEAVKTTAESYMPDGATLVQYNHNVEISWRDINKYAECVNRDDMVAVNPNYKEDLTSDGEWVYPLPNLENAQSVFASAGKLRKLHIVLPKAKTLLHMLACTPPPHSLEKLEDVYIEAPVENVVVDALFHSNWGTGYKDIKKLKCVFPNALNIDYLFRDCHAQTSLEIICPRITSANGAFYGLKLDKPSTLNIFNQLQPYTSGNHPLLIGIHIDHQADAEVLAAIDAATAKGWTVTVQWNGTATT